MEHLGDHGRRPGVNPAILNPKKIQVPKNGGTQTALFSAVLEGWVSLFGYLNCLMIFTPPKKGMEWKT